MLAVFIIVFTLAPKVFAGSATIKNSATVSEGKTFEVVLYVDTDKESINSVDMVLDYGEEILTFVGYKSEGSIVKMWIDAPHANNGTVVLTGIIPGGVSGVFDPRRPELTAIPVVTLLFKAHKVGIYNFSFIKSKILKNDGIGSELTHETGTSKVEVTAKLENLKALVGEETAISTTAESFIDTEKPEPFEIFFIKSSFFSRTPSMIAFNASDPRSGVSQYEVKINDGEWKVVESPYPVPKSLFSQILTVRAVDFFGNTRESVINSVGFIDGNLRLNIWSLTGIVLLLFVILVYKVLSKKIRIKNENIQ